MVFWKTLFDNWMKSKKEKNEAMGEGVGRGAEREREGGGGGSPVGRVLLQFPPVGKAGLVCQ